MLFRTYGDPRLRPAASSPAGPPPTTTLRGRAARSTPCGNRDLVSRGGIVRAVWPVLRLAMSGTDARKYAVLLAALDLAHDVRIGDVRPRHRHHVQQSLANG